MIPDDASKIIDHREYFIPLLEYFVLNADPNSDTIKNDVNRKQARIVKGVAVRKAHIT